MKRQIPGTQQNLPHGWFKKEMSTAETAQGPKSPCGRGGLNVGGLKSRGIFFMTMIHPNSAVCVVTTGVFLRINKNW